MYGMPSCYNNGFAFAQRFVEDGYTVTVVCDQDVSALASKAQIPFLHLESLSYARTTSRYLDITRSRFNSRLQKLLDVFRIVRGCKKLRQQTLEDNEFLDLVSELNPDVLLIDIECHLAVIASSTLAIPTAICTRLFNHRPGYGLPPLHSNLLPSKNRAQRLRIQAQWWKLRLQSFYIAARQSVSKQRIMPIHYRSFSMPDIKAIARRYQVDLWSIATTAQWFRPITYTHAPILSMTVADIDFDREPDPGFKYMGPMIGKRDYAFDLKQEDLTQIERFISQARHNGQAVVYCAMGTYAQREPRFVDLVRTLALLRKDYAFIISLGGREPVDVSHNFPDNALLIEAAPQIKCLTECDVAILHAGIASLQEALLHRVPVLCFSVGSNDQNGTAARWENRKLATRFSHTNASAAQLSLELDRLLNDKELKNRLEQYGQLVDKSVTEFSPKKLIRELWK